MEEIHIGVKKLNEKIQTVTKIYVKDVSREEAIEVLKETVDRLYEELEAEDDD